MITFSSISQANFNTIQLVAQGDASTTTLKLNLTKPPFNLTFSGATPAGYKVDLGGDPDLGTATAALASSVDGDVVTITFSQAPPATETIGIVLTAFYDSAP